LCVRVRFPLSTGYTAATIKDTDGDIGADEMSGKDDMTGSGGDFIDDVDGRL
jgi:hypothetical protein